MTTTGPPEHPTGCEHDQDHESLTPRRRRSWLLRLLILPIRFYQLAISPLTPPSCRYSPTCSTYTVRAIELWGVRGVWMGGKRILRCHPFVEGGYDPVPLPPGHPDADPEGQGA